MNMGCASRLHNLELIIGCEAIGAGQTSIMRFLQDDLILPSLPEIGLRDGAIKLSSAAQ
jgi:hypothetical protein